MEWTPLDDIGRSQAAIRHAAMRAGIALREARDAQAKTLQAMDEFLTALGDGQVDWSEATPEEAAEMLAALDLIQAVRDSIARILPAY